ncbi:NADP-dependent oxidoreductase [Nocardioides immobilis]|uniref:NADP-dependent oxidoreductase n=1 Tax=Nocardioides immobilis TaxID=2049295 RepID=A0A417Y7X7_9ACTN|nr:NADP-dependent oxidoreductase [Nocardioides immobilis]RHW28852.1 NADP-dependent oxidoreductase [Nocardioides immobilis]
MRIITQHTVGDPDVLVVEEVPTPAPGAGEVLVRVGGAAVNPADAAVRAGYFPLLGEPPFTIGWDVAGTVEAIGEGVTDHRVGDRVFGMPRFPAQAAAYADAVVAPADQLARTPDALSDVEAAALPLAALTAYQGLVEVADVQPGQRVLVQAAGGGVGHFAVQIAKARGAHVIAVVSPAKEAFVRALGADEVIDYTAGPFTDSVEPVDVALDPFGSANTPDVLQVVRSGGIVVALLDVDDETRELAAARDVRVEQISVHPSGEQLTAIAALVDSGHLRPHVSATYALEKAGEAHHELATGVQGKVVLVP